jgi:hypothetical protein
MAVIIPATIGSMSHVLSAQSLSTRTDIGESGLVPPPRLIEPATDIVDIDGKQSLEFKWSPHEGDPAKREYYDFRLYKGGQAFAAALIYKARIPRNAWCIYVKADLFETGAIYTCALRQVYAGLKSRRTFQTFKVTCSCVTGR